MVHMGRGVHAHSEAYPASVLQSGIPRAQEEGWSVLRCVIFVLQANLWITTK